MNLENFWEIIETTRAESQQEQLEALERKLRDIAPEGVLQFERRLREYEFAAYNWDLWLVAWLCQGGMCSDDGFADFRSWLVSRGRATCEGALDDADNLAKEIEQTDSLEFELFSYVPGRVYRELTGLDLPDFQMRHPKEPSGGEWMRPHLKYRGESKLINRCVVLQEIGDEEFAAIERRFPRVWKLCVERGIIDAKGSAPISAQGGTLPSPEEVATSVAPRLGETDFGGYLNALGNAARQAYRRREGDDGRNS